MTATPPPTALELLDALDFVPVRCHRCGTVIGECAASGDGAYVRLKCRACKRWTVWPWRARGASAERAAAMRRGTVATTNARGEGEDAPGD